MKPVSERPCSSNSASAVFQLPHKASNHRPMRTEEARPVRLKDYRPPDWLIETVELDVSLHPTATTVRAKLKLKPNAAGAPAPLVLDGEDLKLKSLALDGKPLPAENFVATPDKLTIAQPPNRPFELEIETVVDPTGNTQLMGLYRAGATYCTQCEAEGFRRITYFLDRPDVMAVYTTRIEADKAEAPVLLSNGNLDRARRRAGHARGTLRPGTIRFPKPSYLFALVGGNLASVKDTFTTMSGRKVALVDLCRARQGRPLRLRHGQPQAFHALGRRSLRPRIRSRYFHDRRRLRLQHGRDGEQGAQRLQRQIRAGLADHRDRQRLCRHRSGDRARIFPQLDRRPHHLPRLVSALPEGRADGVPRSGIHRRPALARGRAHQRRARACARINSSRMPARSRTRCGPRSITRSTTSTPRPSTRRAPKSSA